MAEKVTINEILDSKFLSLSCMGDISAAKKSTRHLSENPKNRSVNGIEIHHAHHASGWITAQRFNY